MPTTTVATSPHVQDLADLNGLALVRGRELLDLINALDAANDMIAIIAITNGKLFERHAEFRCGTMVKTVDVLCDLRDRNVGGAP